MTDAVQHISQHLWRQATYERAQARLGQLLDSPSASVRADAARFEEALAGVRAPHPPGVTHGDAPTGELAAARQACRLAREDLPENVLSHEEFEAVLEAQTQRPAAFRSEYLDAVQGFEEAEVRFVQAAKAELHTLPVV
ncbi:hypothetical protein [Streptomyces sp. NPDC048111]|uniref:hypothetical protein n=1 Tax=Streptomyces sp. NPDC048111 TaxID=3365500 RepID=UPI00371362C6